MTKGEEDRIVAEVGKCFSTFGGGTTQNFNPISEWTKDKPPMFALGVDVRTVVQFVAQALRKKRKAVSR